MSLFHMFVTTPDSTPVGDVYQEIQAFGPYSESGESGFSTGTIIGIAETLSQFHDLRAFCDGLLSVLRPPEDSISPVNVMLTPTPFIIEYELRSICKDAKVELPRGLEYFGLDQTTLKNNLRPLFLANDLGGLVERTFEEIWGLFLNGTIILKVDGGFELGKVSESNLVDGYRRFGFAVRTSPVNKRIDDPSIPSWNYLDPVVLYQILSSDSAFGGPAIPAQEMENSWIEIATRDRVLITFRDEWNAPLDAPAEIAEISEIDTIETPLTPELGGTIVIRENWDHFDCRIEGRRLTPIPSEEVLSGQVAEETVIIESIAPAHRVIGTVTPEDWFAVTNPADIPEEFRLSRYSEGNKVEVLIDGLEAFSKIAQDLNRLNSSDHFVLLAYWRIIVDFALVPGQDNTRMEELLSMGDSADALIRALVWDMPLLFNSPAHSLINELSNGESILDDRTHHAFSEGAVAIAAALGLGPGPLASLGSGTLTALLEAYHVGSHHWKYSVIRNSRGTYGYIGGIDINPNRLDDQDHIVDSPYHDVHCRVEGPALDDLTKSFLDRWNDYIDAVGDETIDDPEVASHDRLTTNPAEASEDTALIIPEITEPQDGTCFVQIARTYGANTQSYTPNGERTIWATLKQAIRRSQKYIYIEDQYLVYLDLKDELLSALTRPNGIDHLVIVINGNIPPLEFPFQWNRSRYLFLNPIKEAFPDKLHVFTLRKGGDEINVHTKSVIIDDVFATIGAANMGQRSMTHDSEVNLFVLDGRIDHGSRHFARNLRIKLWAEHLGWHRQYMHQRQRVERILGDIDRAMEFLTTRRPRTSRLHRYDLEKGSGTSHHPGWFDYWDPDGSLPPT